MRRSQTCPKCHHDRILLVSRLDQPIDEYGRLEPWSLARVPKTVEGHPLPGGETVPSGVVQAYVCRACGYTELYTTEPEKIPVDGNVVRELEGGKKSPYR